MMQSTEDEEHINIVVLRKGEERFIFIYTDENTAKCLHHPVTFAQNPDLNFSWHDAAEVINDIRQSDNYINTFTENE